MISAASICRRIALAGWSLGILLLPGCGTTTGTTAGTTVQAKPPVQNAAGQEASPQGLVDSRSTEVPIEKLAVPELGAATETSDDDSIFFPLGSSTLAATEQEKLSHHANRLKEDRGLLVTLIGHADGNGSPSFNLAVADARVTSVNTILRKLGVYANQIRKVVVGSEKRLARCRSVDCRRKMRRVEMVFSKSR